MNANRSTVTTALELAGVCLSAAGNRFVLVDCRTVAFGDDPAGRARGLCERAGAAGFRPDGVLVLSPAQADGDLQLVIYNADGSRPEACGNGLRCVGHYVATTFGKKRTRLHVETDAGTRELLFKRPRPGELHVHVNLGPAQVVERSVDVGFERGAALIEIGNPHCVIELDDLDELDVERAGRQVREHLGRELNVEFVVRRDDLLDLRVFERGVGETESCGTGACAAVRAVCGRPGLDQTLRVRTPGGDLGVRVDAAGDSWLTGPVEVRGRIDLE